MCGRAAVRTQEFGPCGPVGVAMLVTPMSPPPASARLAALADRLPAVMRRDQRTLQKRLDPARRAHDAAERATAPEELGGELGEAVGYTVRFTDKVGEGTFVKVMTDGILLAEIQRDRQLVQYDTLIVDEAHERSLNIDFILGYLKQLLPRRPDLKVIVTSATIDTERFARHFGGAPIVEVSGRTYPGQVGYRPLAGPDAQGVPDAVDTGL